MMDGRTRRDGSSGTTLEFLNAVGRQMAPGVKILKHPNRKYCDSHERWGVGGVGGRPARWWK